MCSTYSLRDPVRYLSCCCKQIRKDDSFFNVRERFSNIEEEFEDQFNFPGVMLDESVQDSFEDENYIPLELDTTEIFEQLSKD